RRSERDQAGRAARGPDARRRARADRARSRGPRRGERRHRQWNPRRRIRRRRRATGRARRALGKGRARAQGEGADAARSEAVPRGNVIILGAGIVGMNALRTAVGLGAEVSILDVNLDRLRHVEELYGNQVVTLMSNSYNVEQAVRRADLLIGAVLVAGARAP